jgi:dienelactone hydrolase
MRNALDAARTRGALEVAAFDRAGLAVPSGQREVEPFLDSAMPRATAAAIRGSGFTTFGRWFGPAGRPLAGWWTVPARMSGGGVVIAPPLGYEYWPTHRSLRTLAESLARAGWHALRFDWDGTGDSAGDPSEPSRVAMWRASLAHAVRTMREAGLDHVAIAGVCLGATFALLDGAALGADAVIACAPVASGKRWLRELRMLGIADPSAPETLMYAGLVIDAESAADLAKIDLAKKPPQAVRRTLLVTRSESSDRNLIAALRGDGRTIGVHPCEAIASMLDVPCEEADVPEGLIPQIASWLGEAPATTRLGGVRRHAATAVPWKSGMLREHFVQLGGLTAVQCNLPEHGNQDTAVVFLNSGSESHVGPGRAWVEYSRTLALHGCTCLRTDFSGWGESPDEGHAPGRPYDAHCVDETVRIVAALRASHARIVLVGLCASAWVALKAAQHIPVDGVFALNPQLYWQPGDPVEALIVNTHRRRTMARACEALGRRLRLWSMLDAIGIRPKASRWLSSLRRRGTPVLLCFAKGDDGLLFLRNRCGRWLARETRRGTIRLAEIPGVDHQMYRLWQRPAIEEQLIRFVASPHAAQPGREGPAK